MSSLNLLYVGPEGRSASMRNLSQAFSNGHYSPMFAYNSRQAHAGLHKAEGVVLVGNPNTVFQEAASYHELLRQAQAKKIAVAALLRTREVLPPNSLGIHCISISRKKPRRVAQELEEFFAGQRAG